jgi:hypothetical protein
MEECFQRKDMISDIDLEEVARARLEDSMVLACEDRYEGSVYLCGYSVEIALKVRICKHNARFEFPETSSEFNTHGLQRWRTHNLSNLLNLSGLNAVIRGDSDLFRKFNCIATNWAPDYRYKKLGSTDENRSFDMIESAESLIGVIL